MSAFSTLAERLFASVGASAVFIDDVIGDIEEDRCARVACGQACGRVWWVGQVLQAFPYALRDGLRGVGLGPLLNWAQKALAAWMLLSATTVFASGLTYGAWQFGSGVMGPPSPAFTVLAGSAAMLMAAVARYALLGYIAAWMERERPLFVCLMASVIDGGVHLFAFRSALSEAPLEVCGLLAITSLLVMAGGFVRVLRPHPSAN